MKLCLSLLLFVSGTLLSQEETAKHTLRILPVGDAPPFIQEVRDGLRYEVPAKEGAIPPRNILLAIPAPKDEKQEPLPLRVRLGAPSSVLTFPLPENRSVNTTLQSGDPWLTIPLSKGDSTLALVWRGKDWFQPRVISVPDDTKDGDFRFINLTAKPMAVTWGNEKLKLNPATAMTRRMPDGSNALPLTIQFPTADGKLQSCLSTQVEKAPGTRYQFVIYAADGKEVRMPVKVLPLTEQL